MSQVRRPSDAPPLYVLPGGGEPDEVQAEVRDLAVPEPEDLAVREETAVVEWAEPLPPPAIPRVLAVIVIRTREAATHEGTKAVVRNAAYVPIGAGVVLKRLWEAKTNSRFERILRSIEPTGNLEALGEWTDRAEQARERRHRRRMDWVNAPFALAKGIGAALLTGVGVLIVIGILMAAAARNVREVGAPLMGVVHLIGGIAWLVSATWTPAVFLSPLAVTAYLWHLGRISGAGPRWLIGADGAGAGSVVTADGIVIALRHLQIAQLTRAFDKEAFIPKFHQPPRRDGRGYWAVVELPLGVTAEMIADKRAVLARNLGRAEIETWPSDAEKVNTGQAGYLDLWIADPGALSKPAPEYPLLHEGAADVFEGVPGGVSPRGDRILIPIVSNNIVAGGQMGQGKSNACRVVLLGCALDPLCIIDAFVFANNGDFDSYRPRLNIYRRGIDDETAHAALQRLRWYYEEVGRREGRLAELGAKKVTRKIATEHPDLRPIVGLFSECHELFDHPEFGEEAGELATKTAKRARKVAMTLVFDTQSSRKEAIPPKLVELVSVNICFYVKTWRSNDGFLGDGCFQAGIRATELRPGRDRGTSLVIGVSDSPFELLKWHFIEVNDDTGWDAATDVIARAVENLAPGTPAADGGKEVEAPVERDLLEDLEAVLGEEAVPLANLPKLLARYAPDWMPYRKLTGKALRDVLAREHGVKVPSTGNRWPVHPRLIADALARREVR
jgi:S-DNA-T family DNA segregation ATPase FtsK/SpoIIIE